MLTLVDLGVLREVAVDDAGAVVVAITPTYSGCPAMATMRDDLVRTLQDAGFADVRVRVALDPAWTTDWITPEGRAALRGRRHLATGTGRRPTTGRAAAQSPLQLTPTRRAVRCPRCGSDEVRLTSEFGSTACKAMYQCRACLEPFDHVKEI